MCVYDVKTTTACSVPSAWVALRSWKQHPYSTPGSRMASCIDGNLTAIAYPREPNKTQRTCHRFSVEKGVGSSRRHMAGAVWTDRFGADFDLANECCVNLCVM